MSKKKISFSLLLAILLVGILSVVAYAAATPSLSPAPKIRVEADNAAHKLIINWGQIARPADTASATYAATDSYNVYVDSDPAVNIPNVAGQYLYSYEVNSVDNFKEYAIRLSTVTANGEKKSTVVKVVPAEAPVLTDWTSTSGAYSVSWSAVPDADGYKVSVDGAAPTTTASLTYTDSSATNNEKHDVVVYAYKGSVSGAAATFEIAAGGPQYNQELASTLVGTDTANDNGIVNANKSGVNVGGQSDNFATVIKSNGMKFNDKTKATGTHRTHGEYQNNTNSCASCHQTHTAASKNLLFKNGVYATCTACHDGTLGFYNVFETDPTKVSKSAGTFGGTTDGNMSVHLATGAVSIKAAPGGNKKGEGSWGGEFTCASCHAPHGSYSDRLLHFNPNAMGETPVAEGGLKLVDYPIYDDGSKPTTKSTDIILVRKTLVAGDVASGSLYYNSTLAAGDVVIQAWKWTDEVANADGSVTAAGYTTADKTPWLYGYEFSADHSYREYWSALYDYPNATARDDYFKEGSKEQADAQIFNASTDKYAFVWKDGYAAYRKSNYSALLDAATAKGDLILTAPQKTAKITAADKFLTVDHADVSRAYVVKLQADPNNQVDKGAFKVYNTAAPALWGGYNIYDTTQSKWVTLNKSTEGPKMSAFCSACHTDYLANSGTETGTFDHAYRHTTTSATYTCVRCHFAHGTDVSIMKDSQGRTMADLTGTEGWTPTEAKDYMLDKSTDSALKRFTNMSVCWGCHTSSHSEGFRNNDYYKYGTTTGDATMGLTNGQ
jgi:predicted CXXCH cytochrome family protein